jgi:hypothetical protein
LEAVLQHGAVVLLKDSPADVHPVVRTDSEDVVVVRSVVNLAMTGDWAVALIEDHIPLPQLCSAHAPEDPACVGGGQRTVPVLRR